MKRIILFILLAGLAVQSGFAQKPEGKKLQISDKKLADVIYVMGEIHPEGFTLDLNTMQLPPEGLIVSYKETQNSFSRKSIRKVIKHAREHDNLVGGWYNPEEGDYYFDSNRSFPKNIRWGRFLKFL